VQVILVGLSIPLMTNFDLLVNLFNV